jgi:hypothetical protein
VAHPLRLDYTRLKKRLDGSTSPRWKSAEASFVYALVWKPLRCQAMTVIGLTIIKERSPIAPKFAKPRPEESIDGRQFGPLHRAAQDAELVPEREVFQLECGSRLEGHQSGGAKHMKCAERQTEELTENAQGPFSHSVRSLRYPQSPVFPGPRPSRASRTPHVCGRLQSRDWAFPSSLVNAMADPSQASQTLRLRRCGAASPIGVRLLASDFFRRS